MTNTVNSVLNAGFLKFTFTDNDGDVFASFKIKPTDPRLMGRCKSISQFFDDLAADSEEKRTPAQWEEIVEDKFCEFLGYDCRKSLFSQVAATDVIDGKMFANHILDAVVREVGPYLRRQRAQKIARHTGKYKK